LSSPCFVPGTKICFGEDCFRTVSWMGAAICFIGAAWSTQMMRWKREDAVGMHTTMKMTLPSK
jgi:hypothetical protein